jgi:MFS transporter, OFA family, oxalate/formate antiporter
MAFTVMMTLGGASAAVFGRFVERKGPRKSAIVAAVLFGLGQAGSGFAVAIDSLTMFILCYGLLSGIGLGNRLHLPGVYAGKVVSGQAGAGNRDGGPWFGTGALITAPVAAYLMETIGISTTFYVLGSCYFLLMLFGALYIAPPPADWIPEGMKLRQNPH